MEIIAQIIGIFAMGFNVLSYQGKTQKHIMYMQLAASVLFIIHFMLLGAWTGGILNCIGLIRAIVFSQRDHKWASGKHWIALFIGASILFYIINITVFMPGKEFLFYLIEVLPVLAMGASTLAFYMTDAGKVRAFSLMSSPLWLIYNIVNRSIGGALTETFAIISIFIGMLRHDRKKGENQ